MARVSEILFCMKANNLEREGVSAINILSAITPEYVPGLFTFSVIVIILDLDFTKEHNFSIDFKDPEGNVLVHVDGTLPIQEIESNLPKEHLGVNIGMDWNNVEFKRSGLYLIEVNVDQELIGNKEIYVKGKNE